MYTDESLPMHLKVLKIEFSVDPSRTFFCSLVLRCWSYRFVFDIFEIGPNLWQDLKGNMYLHNSKLSIGSKVEVSYVPKYY